MHSKLFSSLYIVCTGTRIRTTIKGFGDLYSTIELCPYLPAFALPQLSKPFSKKMKAEIGINQKVKKYHLLTFLNG